MKAETQKISQLRADEKNDVVKPKTLGYMRDVKNELSLEIMENLKRLEDPEMIKNIGLNTEAGEVLKNAIELSAFQFLLPQIDQPWKNQMKTIVVAPIPQKSP